MSDRISHMAMHRMKDVAIKTKENMINERRSDDRSSSRFSNAAIDTTEYAAGEGVLTGKEAVQAAYRKYGEKKIRCGEQNAKYAEQEIRENETQRRIGSRIREANIEVNRSSRVRKAANSGASQNVPKTATAQNASYLKSQHKYVVKKYQKQKAASTTKKAVTKNGAFRRIGSAGAKGAETAVKGVVAAGKSLFTTLAAAGSSVILVIVICIFLSASVYLFGQDTTDEYSAEALGVGDTLIIRVASAQLGNVGGLKFCKWYGFNGRVEWCACFVSWCANQCGYIDKGIIPKFALVGDGVDWFKARGRLRNNKYIPHPGDIIFFDWDSDGTRDHVGFVERCDGKTVYTIEGNSGDACKRLAYRVGHPEIHSYGVPAY